MTSKQEKLKKILGNLSDIDSGVKSVYKSVDDELKDVAEKLKKSVEIRTIQEANEQFKNLQKLFKPLIPKFDELSSNLNDRDRKLIEKLKEKFALVETTIIERTSGLESDIDSAHQGIQNLSERLGVVEDKEITFPDYTEVFDLIGKNIVEKTKEIEAKIPNIEPIITDITTFRDDLAKIKGRGGSANQQINVNSSVMSRQYSDFNFVSNTAIRWVASDDNVNKRVNIQASLISGGAGGGGASLNVTEVDGAPYVSSVTTIVVSNGTLTDDGGGQVTISTGGGGSGISRVTSVLSVSSTMAAGAQTDYVFFPNVGVSLILPTAIGNSNLYTVKNFSPSSVIVLAPTGQDIDGSTSALMPTINESLSFMSNNSVWGVV